MRRDGSDRAGSDIGAFSIMPDWIIRSMVSDRAKCLFALIGRYADRDHEAFPSRRALAAVLRTSVNSIDRATKELVDIGALEVLPRVDHAGDRTSNLYRLIYAQPAGVAPRMGPPLTTGETTGGPTRGGTVAPRVVQGTITSGTRTTLNEKERVEQRRSAAVRFGQKVDSFRCLVKLTHDVLDDVERGAVHQLDLMEEIKTRAARARLTYDKAHAAVRSADVQRKRRRAK